MKPKNVKNFKIIKLILLIITIILLIAITIKLLPLFLNLGTSEGQTKFRDEISNSGPSGVLMLLGLQVLQILIPILPGEPIEFLAGMCYGTIDGMLLIFLGAFLSSFIIFFCVRKFGRNFIHTFFGEDQINKLENSKWLSSPQKIEFFLCIAFLIPGTPKDLFVYIAGLLPIRASRFLIISTFCRFPSVITSTFAGSNLAEGNWKITLIAYAITLIISGIGIFIYERIKTNSNKNSI